MTGLTQKSESRLTGSIATEALYILDEEDDDPQLACDLSKWLRDREMHEIAFVCAARGLRQEDNQTPDELCFQLKAEIATSGYYSTNHEARELGHRMCEELTLSRDCPRYARHIASENLFYYTKRLSEYASSFQTQRIEIDMPNGFYPTNPSICRLGDMMVMNVRCVDYLTEENEKVILPDHGPPSTVNVLLYINRDLTYYPAVRESMSFSSFPMVNKARPRGVEDVRLFVVGWNGKLWGSGTILQTRADGRAEITYGPYVRGEIDWVSIPSPMGMLANEKNWAPITNLKASGPRFIYSHDPFRLVNGWGHVVHADIPPVAAHTWSGSTQAIPFEIASEAGHLVMIHEKTYHPHLAITRRRYQQRFVWYDQDWRLRRLSRRFEFDNGETEFPCGMCVHPDGRRLIISYGVLDREAWLASIAIDEVLGMLRCQ